MLPTSRTSRTTTPPATQHFHHPSNLPTVGSSNTSPESLLHTVANHLTAVRYISPTAAAAIVLPYHTNEINTNFIQLHPSPHNSAASPSAHPSTSASNAKSVRFAPALSRAAASDDNDINTKIDFNSRNASDTETSSRHVERQMPELDSIKMGKTVHESPHSTLMSKFIKIVENQPLIKYIIWAAVFFLAIRSLFFSPAVCPELNCTAGGVPPTGSTFYSQKQQNQQQLNQKYDAALISLLTNPKILPVLADPSASGNETSTFKRDEGGDGSGDLSL